MCWGLTHIICSCCCQPHVPGSATAPCTPSWERSQITFDGEISPIGKADRVEGGVEMKPLRLPAALAAVALVATACSSDGGDGESGAYPREETLYTTGTAWEPPTNWNSRLPQAYAVGPTGWAYEPPFHHDP